MRSFFRLASAWSMVAVVLLAATPALAQTTITTSTTVSGTVSYAGLTVGGASPGPTLTIDTGAAITATRSDASSFIVGTQANQYATVIQNGGSVVVGGGTGSIGQLYLGQHLTSGNTGYTGSASYTLNAGTITLGSGTSASGILGIGRSSDATFTQNGGLITAYRNNVLLFIGSAGNGSYSITSGTFEGIGSAGPAAGLGIASNAGVSSSGTLTINGAGATVAVQPSGANLTARGGTATVNLLNGTLALNGEVTRGVAGSGQTPGTVSFTLGGGTLRPYDANLVVGSSTATNTAAFDITLAANSLSTITGVGWKSGTSTVTIASPIVGSGSIQFTGGTVSLTATNTYSGATTITGTNTTLALGANGTLASSPTIRVGNAGSSGAVLDLTAKTGTFTFTSGRTVAGIGTINIGSGKTVSSAGIWAPGNSIGSNAVTGNLLLSGTSQFELGTPGSSTSSPGLSDFTAVSGTLTLGGALQLVNNAGADGNGSAAGGVYRLFTYGAVSGSYASVTTNPSATTVTGLGNISYGGSGTAAGQGVFLTVYDRAVASFGSGPTALTSLTLDFLSVNQGDTVSPQTFNLYNLLQTAGFTADLALLSITPDVGNTGALTTNLATFNSLASGTFNSWQASVNTSNQGTFTNTWTLQFKSSNGGTVYANDTPQTLTLTTNVIVVPEPGAIALAGIGIAAAAYTLRRRSRSLGARSAC